MEGAIQEEAEVPLARQLFRQSSLETRLYPAQDDASDGDSADEGEVEKATLRLGEDTKPRVVSMVIKQTSRDSTVVKNESQNSRAVSMQPSIPSTVLPKRPIDLNNTEKLIKPSPKKSPVQSAVDASPPVKVLEPEPQPAAPEVEPRKVRFNDRDSDDSQRCISLGHPQTVTLLTAGPRAQPVTSTIEMASPRPKSPRPPTSARKDEKEESFWEKIGTLGRKKRIKEVQEVQDEGKYAIDSPGNAAAVDLPPEEYALEENEERSMITPQSYEDRRLRELMYVLTEWINDELASHRIIVKDVEEDLYDGQVLHKLLERLTGERLDVPEVTQSEEGQRQKLGVVLSTANRVLGLPRWSQQKWSVESVHSKNIVAILHLLVALARHFRAPVRLPENVSVQVVVVQMHNGALSHRTVTEEITATYDDLGMRGERDAFDTLFDHAPDKLQVVKKSLVTFVNKHLNKLNLEVNDLDTQFHDGVYLALLMGLLEGFFVPLYAFHNTPHDFDQKVHNVNVAFDLMQEVGLARPKARPEDIVNLDLKSTLRVLYNLFTKYKGLS